MEIWVLRGMVAPATVAVPTGVNGLTLGNDSAFVPGKVVLPCAGVLLVPRLSGLRRSCSRRS